MESGRRDGVEPGSATRAGQGPTIDSGPQGSPGTKRPLMGPAPGSGGGSLADSPGSDAPILGGRAGTSAPHVPTSLFAPEDRGATVPRTGITAPRPKKLTELPIFGTLALPADVAGGPTRPPAGDLLKPPAEVMAEGPPDGLTLDMAIEWLITHSLDLRAKFMEIPQAQADVLSAGLRANPIFYADSQLIPYGQFDRSRPGGQTQYDVNISHPVDVTRKRQARIRVCSAAKRVLEAQYQDAVRMEIDKLYSAYVDVLAARQTAVYTRKSHETWAASTIRVAVEVQGGGIDPGGRQPGKDPVREQLHRNARRRGNPQAEEAEPGSLAQPASPGRREDGPVRIDRGSSASSAPESELFQIALAARPDVVSYRLGVQRAEADVKLARANRMSDIYVLYQPYTLQNNTPFGLKSPTSWALGVTVPLPVYNRNQGNILRAQLNVTQTASRTADARAAGDHRCPARREGI